MFRFYAPLWLMGYSVKETLSLPPEGAIAARVNQPLAPDEFPAGKMVVSVVETPNGAPAGKPCRRIDE